MNYTSKDNSVSFSGKNLPALWLVTMAQLEIHVTLTGDKRQPYSVNLSESEFLSCLEMAKGL